MAKRSNKKFRHYDNNKQMSFKDKVHLGQEISKMTGAMIQDKIKEMMAEKTEQHEHVHGEGCSHGEQE